MQSRKDKDPAITISYAQKFLSSIGLDVELAVTNAVAGKSYAARISCKCMPDIGANGKGVTKELACASAYAEFFERLQSNQLENGIFRIKHTRPKGPENGQTRKIIEGYLKNIPDLFFDKECKEGYLQSTNLLNLTENYYIDLKNRSIVSMPEELICYSCGSNGTCAGNSPEEALTQGICEIMERYVQQVIIFKGFPLKLIPTDWYRHFNIYSLIEEIEKSNFHLYVFDCTIEGRFPVVGALLLNPLQTKYLFSLGSDLSLEISIQRCITEIFQGRKLDIHLEKSMIEICSDKQLDFEKARQENDLFPLYMELRKANINKTGCIPFSNFKLCPTDKNNLSLFHDDILSNKQAVALVYEIAKKEFGSIFIHDYTKSDIHTFRIYCPGVTEFIKIDKNSLSNLKNEEKLIVYLRRLADNKIEENEYPILIHLLENLSSSLSCDPIPIIFGIPVSDYSKYLLDVNYLLSYLYYHMGDLVSAYSYLEQVRAPSPNSKILFLRKILKLKSKGINTSFLEEISNISFQYDLSIMPKCPNCEGCNRASDCSQYKWERIYSILSKYKEKPNRQNYIRQSRMLNYLTEEIGL